MNKFLLTLLQSLAVMIQWIGVSAAMIGLSMGLAEKPRRYTYTHGAQSGLAAFPLQKPQPKKPSHE